MKRAAAKGARSKSKKASKPNYLRGDKVVSEKDIRLTIKALLLQNFFNAKMKEQGKIAIKFFLTLKTERQTVMYVMKDVVNDRDGKAQ